MFAEMPLLQQCLILAGATLAVVFVGLKLYNRRETRRKHAIELAMMMNEWGLKWFAEAYIMYAVGDYSGLAHKVKEIIGAVRSDEAMAAKLYDVGKKVATYCAENEPGKAAELLAILQGKPAKKG